MIVLLYLLSLVYDLKFFLQLLRLEGQFVHNNLLIKCVTTLVTAAHKDLKHLLLSVRIVGHDCCLGDGLGRLRLSVGRGVHRGGGVYMLLCLVGKRGLWLSHLKLLLILFQTFSKSYSLPGVTARIAIVLVSIDHTHRRIETETRNVRPTAHSSR